MVGGEAEAAVGALAVLAIGGVVELEAVVTGAAVVVTVVVVKGPLDPPCSCMPANSPLGGAMELSGMATTSS